MKPIAASLLVLTSLGFLSLTPSVHAANSLDAILSSYLEIHARLAADSVDGVKAPAAAIAKNAAGMGEAGKDIAAAAQKVEQASDLKAARAAFVPLSDAMIAAGKAQGWKGLENVRVAFCPMANAHWLQKEKAIRNPYYGQQMLACGEFKER